MAASAHPWPAALLGLDRELRALAGLARGRGARLALVGGSVRDALLGRASRDVDLVVEGGARALVAGAAAAAALSPLGGELRATGAFDTVRWQLAGGGHLDLAGARAERYPHPGALPEVWPADLATDLWRRDFAANAMALVLGEVGAPVPLLDPTGGAADLPRRQLRALHPASFLDDPTRLWRGHRLAARLGWRWQRQTARWAREAAAGGAGASISPKRRGAELQLALAEACAPRALGRLVGAGLLPAWPAQASCLVELWGGARPSPSLPAAARAVRRAWREQVATPPDAPGPTSALWLLVALGQEGVAAARLREEAAHLGGGLRNILVGGPVRLRALAVAATGQPSPPAALAAQLSATTPAERAVACALLPRLRPALRWWAAVGQARRSLVDGEALRRRGHTPGPAFAPALAAAQQRAWQGAEPAEQLAAAEAALRAARQPAPSPVGPADSPPEPEPEL